MRRTTSLAGLLIVSLGLFTGCTGKPPAAEFVYQKTTASLHPVTFGKHTSKTNPIQAALLENFGTPNQLVVWEVFPIEYGEPEPASADPARHVKGWKIKEGRDLYMVHCVHCHGTSGDGNGPTAKFLNPLPRDYRNGVFKFTSTDGGIKPSRADLKNVVDQGIAGTSMPAFHLLGDEKVEMLVEYVRFLSMRGEYERRLYQGLKEFDLSKDVEEARKTQKLEEIEAEIAQRLKDEEEDLFVLPATDIADTWARAESPEMIVQPREVTILKGAQLFSTVEPRPKASDETLPEVGTRVALGPQVGEYWQIKQDDKELGYVHQSFLEARTGIDENGNPTPESIALGRELYLSEDVFCYKCHGQSGRGDGPNTEIYWPIPNTTPELTYEDVGLHDEWGHVIIPRNLTRPVYRGGRRPIDFYRRLRVGIKGTPMPGYSTAKYKGKNLTDNELWAVVNFIYALPFEQGKTGTKEKPAAKVATK